MYGEGRLGNWARLLPQKGKGCFSQPCHSAPSAQPKRRQASDTHPQTSTRRAPDDAATSEALTGDPPGTRDASRMWLTNSLPITGSGTSQWPYEDNGVVHGRYTVDPTIEGPTPDIWECEYKHKLARPLFLSRSSSCLHSLLDRVVSFFRGSFAFFSSRVGTRCFIFFLYIYLRLRLRRFYLSYHFSPAERLLLSSFS